MVKGGFSPQFNNHDCSGTAFQGATTTRAPPELPTNGFQLYVIAQLGQDIPGTNGDGRRPCAPSARRAVVSPSSCCSPARCPTRSRPGRSADHTRLGLTNNFTRYPRMASSAARHPCPACRLDPAREPAQETDAHTTR